MEPSKGVNWIQALWKMYNFPQVCMAPGSGRRLAHRVVKGKLEHYSPVLKEWGDSVIDQDDMTEDWVEVEDSEWFDGYVQVHWATAFALRARYRPLVSDNNEIRVLAVIDKIRYQWRYDFILVDGHTKEDRYKFYMRKDLYDKYFSA